MAAMSSAAGDYSAGAMIPITRSFVQTSGGSAITTDYTLIGQVLYNGHTNWVGYGQGSADYLMTTSAANAKQTTLADGNTYYFSDGKAPAGYLAGVTMTAMSSGASESAGTGSVASEAPLTTSGSDSMASSSSSSSDESSSGSSSGSAKAATTSSSSGNKLNVGAVFTLAIGLLGVFSL